MNITETDVENCLDFLRDTAQDYAQWRAREKFLEQKLRYVEAKGFVEEGKGAVDARRMQARASDDYKECLDNYHEAKYHAEYLAVQRDAAQNKISFFQTMTKNSRGGF